MAAWPYTLLYSRSSLCFKNDCIFIILKYQRTLNEYESKATFIKNVHVFKLVANCRQKAV